MCPSEAIRRRGSLKTRTPSISSRGVIQEEADEDGATEEASHEREVSWTIDHGGFSSSKDDIPSSISRTSRRTRLKRSRRACLRCGLSTSPRSRLSCHIRKQGPARQNPRFPSLRRALPSPTSLPSSLRRERETLAQRPRPFHLSPHCRPIQLPRNPPDPSFIRPPPPSLPSYDAPLRSTLLAFLYSSLRALPPPLRPLPQPPTLSRYGTSKGSSRTTSKQASRLGRIPTPCLRRPGPTRTRTPSFLCIETQLPSSPLHRRATFLLRLTSSLLPHRSSSAPFRG